MGNIVVTKMNVSWTHNRADTLHLKTSNFIKLNPKIRLWILHSIILGIGILSTCLVDNAWISWGEVTC